MAKKMIFKIFIDEHSGEVDKVETTKRFVYEGCLFKMDVIKDTIIELEEMYQSEQIKYFSQFNNLGEA